MNSYPGLDQVIVNRDDFLHGISADKEGRVCSGSSLGLDDLQFPLIREASGVEFFQHSLCPIYLFISKLHQSRVSELF